MTAPRSTVAPSWDVTTMQTVADAGSLGDAAARYADLGIPVFPCAPGAKQPLTRRGFHDATTSGRVVRQWWQRTPRANIGIPTGAASGVEVVDVDVHAGASGFPSFERARRAGGAEAWGWLVRTPSGGLHAYYPSAVPTERSTGSPRLEPQPCWQSPGAHVDFRGDGGYIVAPPSLIEVDGIPVAYTVIATAHHSPAPLDATNLRRLLDPEWDPARPRPTVTTAQSRTSQPAAQPARLAAWVAALPEGGRNGGLFWAACRMAESGHCFQDTLATVGAGGREAGLTESEVQATVASAFKTTRNTTQGCTTPPGRFAASRQLKGIEL